MSDPQDISPPADARARIEAALPGVVIICDQDERLVGFRWEQEGKPVRERSWVMDNLETAAKAWDLLARNAEKLAATLKVGT